MYFRSRRGNRGRLVNHLPKAFDEKSDNRRRKYEVKTNKHEYIVSSVVIVVVICCITCVGFASEIQGEYDG